MATARVTSKGQLTIPKKVREALDLKPGDRVLFIQLDDSSVTLIAQNKPIQRLKGMFGKFHRTVTIEEMNETIARAGAGLPEPDDENVVEDALVEVH